MEIENIKELILKIQENRSLAFLYEELSVQIIKQAESLDLFSCVFSDENYLPQRVRAFAENHCFDQTRKFLIDEESFKITYNQRFKPLLEPFYLFDRIDSFAFETRRWKAFFDDLSNQDLVFIHQS